MNKQEPGQYNDDDGGWPRWVKIALIAAAVGALVAVAVMLLGGGGHQGPSRHFSSEPIAAAQLSTGV